MANRPNTAPEGKMKSKFITNRTNAVKEIEAWVKGGSNYPQRDAVRMSGQLTDNVTEERMLKAKLWELSRERYKFLSQSAYERKVFMDRMQRKSSALRKSLLQRETMSASSKSDRRSKSSNARMAMLDRLDPTKARDRPKEFKDISVKAQNPRERNIKSVRFGQRLLPEDGNASGQGRFLNRPTVAILSEQNLIKIERKEKSKLDFDHKSLPDITVRTAPRPVGSYRAFQTEPEPLQISTWAQKRTRLGSMSSSATSLTSVRLCTDPRIMKLENSLSPVHISATSADVETVVSQIASLHLPPKINKETNKPKTALKIIQHMRARGLIT